MAAVQGNLDQRTKWQSHQFDANFDRHWEPTLGLPEADLVVWPEASFTDFRENRPQLLQAMDAVVSERGQGLIIGLPDRDENGYTNTALGLGEVDGSYAKRHLVPFGEYVPLEQWLRGVIAFSICPCLVTGRALSNKRHSASKDSRCHSPFAMKSPTRTWCEARLRSPWR